MGIDYDRILQDVGECGLWQKWLFILLSFPSALSAMAVYMYEFLAYTPKHRCYIDGCDSVNSQFSESHMNYSLPWVDGAASQCQMYEYTIGDMSCKQELFSDKQIDCNEWVWDDSFLDSTATVDLDMVCSKSWRRSSAQTIYMVGMTVGSLCFGWMSDKFGRKITLIFTSQLLVIGGCLPFIAQANSFPIFAISRFLSGLGHAGTFMMTFALALEIVGPSYRVLFGIIIETPFAMGGLIVGLVSYLGVTDWRTLALVLSAPNILTISFWWLLPESPRWLISKGKDKQLQTDVAKIARVNKKAVPNIELYRTKSEDGDGSASILDLARPKQILVRSLVMFFNWFVTNMCFYGLTSSASVLLEDIYINYTLVILVEIPAHFLCVFLLSRWGRRPLLGACQLLAGISCIIAGLINSDGLNYLKVIMALLGKFGATGSFAIVFVYTAELFPTEIRSTAVGASSTCARLGGILAPQVAALSTLWKPLPLLILGGGAAIGGVLVLFFLPETLGTKLPENMQEAIDLGKKEKRVAGRVYA